MPDPVITQRRIQVEHVRIEAEKPFAEVKAALEELLPPRDFRNPGSIAARRHRAGEGTLRHGLELATFNGRDQWRIAAHCRPPAQGRAVRDRQSVQSVHGCRMTQYQLAGLPRQGCIYAYIPRQRGHTVTTVSLSPWTITTKGQFDNATHRAGPTEKAAITTWRTGGATWRAKE